MSLSKKRKTRTKKKKRQVKALILILTGILASILALIFSIFIFAALAMQDVPNLQKAEAKFKRPETSKIFDAGGQLITNMYIEQNRINVPLERISPLLQESVIAIEDERFYEHEGVDLKAIARALFNDLRQGRIAEGGSTLTQQYVKNTIISSEKTFTRKTKEAALAYEIEKKYSKKEILGRYLNTVYFGQSAYGAETASLTFFGKSAADLSLADAALLAGVIRSPNKYSPYLNPEIARARRDTVIKKMLELGKVNEAEANAALAEPVNIRAIDDSGSGKYPYFVDYVKRLILVDSRFGQTDAERADSLYKGGLRIYTTIDPGLQAIADETVWGTLNQPGDPAGSIVAIEPKTGYIKAMVGGQDYNTQKFNLAVQAKRQPGSAFKPFVLATALEEGIPVSKMYDSSPGTFNVPGGKPWTVKNSSRSGGPMTLKQATQFSVNAVFARLILDVGPSKVVDVAHKLGITSKVDAYPAIALGGLGEGVSVLEMAAAYSTFANGGLRAQPIAVTKVTDAKGAIIFENRPTADHAIDPVTAYLVTDVLQDVINGGTGTNARIGRPAAGKTGTTEENGDAWFVGYTPDLAAAVWIGHREGPIPMKSIHGVTVFGGTFPAGMWSKFMSKALAGVPASRFERPKNGLTYIKVCTMDGINMLANEFCPEEVTAYMPLAKGSSANLKPCDRHKAPPNVKVPNVIGMGSEDAQKTLTDLGFAVTVNQTPSNAVPGGQVISQSPGEGAELAQGSQVTIAVSSGPSPAATNAVPNVVGMTESNAKTALAGFNVNVVYVVPGSPSQNGKVISQSPTGGSHAPGGSDVTINVGKL